MTYKEARKHIGGLFRHKPPSPWGGGAGPIYMVVDALKADGGLWYKVMRVADEDNFGVFTLNIDQFEELYDWLTE